MCFFIENVSITSNGFPDGRSIIVFCGRVKTRPYKMETRPCKMETRRYGSISGAGASPYSIVPRWAAMILSRQTSTVAKSSPRAEA